MIQARNRKKKETALSVIRDGKYGSTLGEEW